MKIDLKWFLHLELQFFDMKRFLILSLITLLCTSAYAQETNIELQYFSFMVVPMTDDGTIEDPDYEGNADIRNAITIIEEQFLERGFQVYDFVARFAHFKNNNNLQDSFHDTKAEFLNEAAPDIYCELSIEEINCGNSEKKARISLKSYLTNSGRLINNKTFDSNCFVSGVTFLDLIRSASNMYLGDYVDRLEKSLNTMAIQGQPVTLSLTIDDNVGFDFNSDASASYNDFEEEGGMAEIISYWLDDQVDLVKYYKVAGQTSQLMRIEELRIPLVDPQTKRIYNVEKFNRVLRRFLGKIKLTDFPGIEKLRLNITRVNGVSTIHLTN